MKSTTLVLPVLVLALLLGLAPQTQAQSGIVSFQEGVGGYVGTLDTQLRFASSNANAGASTSLISDQSDGTPAGPAQILLRFDNVFGSGPGQIPLGVTIRKAELILYSSTGNAQSGGTISLHRLLQDWTEDCTWASCFGGDSVQPDDIEATTATDSTFVPNFPDPATNGRQSRTNDVTTALAAWSAGGVNYGWVLINSATDGYRMDSSENAAAANHPLLIVEYGACTPPSFTQSPANTTVTQCTTATFSVQVAGSTPITLQWNKDGFPIDTVANPSAATATLTLTNVQDADEGSYTVTAVNECGSPTSSAGVLTVDPDTAAPTIVSAVFDAFDLTRLVVTFSEPVEDNANDNFSWGIDSDPPGETLGIVAPGTFTRPAMDQIAFVFDPPRNVAKKYTLFLNGEIHDRCTMVNAMPFGTTTPITNPGLGFQQGINGYEGTQDTEIHHSTPDTVGGTSGGPDGALITVDNDDNGGFRARGLLRFDNIFGSGANQIPFGSTISNATLTMGTADPGSNPISIYRMLIDWSEAATTWNTLGGDGIDDGTNGTEAVFFGTLNPTPDEGTDNVDVTALVQEWANGAPNYGWAFVASGTDGWDFYTSENGNQAMRPRLLVQYAIIVEECSIIDQPDSMTVNECDSFTLSVAARGTGLTYQWKRNDVDIPGATASSYTVADAKPSLHGGTYRVVVNGTVGPSTCNSDPATVTITPDTARPTVVSALGNPDQTTITITFADQCPLNQAEAENTANYTVSGGVTVNSAVLNGMVVTLTTSARAPGNNYSLTIGNIHDTADANNVLDPNPTVISTLEQHVLVLARDATWKYHNVGADLGDTWDDVGYDDSAWLSAQALLGLETSAGTRTSLFNQGWNTNNLFLLSRTNSTGGGLNGTNITDYFRTTVNIPFSLSSAVIEIRHVTDDGGVYYFNGTEVGRFNMPTGPVDYLTEALTAAGEGVVRTIGGLTGLATGDNTIAVSIHQNDHNSSDVVFGLELVAIYGATPPTLSIVNNGDGTVTLSWTPAGGTLQESTDLTNWVASGNQANPQTFTPTGLRFFRIAP